MKKSQPVTLVMLLSMAKLQQGQKPEGGFDKRWQTPDEVVSQLQEALTLLEKTGRKADIKLLYTDTLYLNNDAPGVELIKKIQQQTFDHRQKIQELLDEKKIETTTLLWSEIVQAQKELQQPRDKLAQIYKKNPAFRAAVQSDNPKRKGVQDDVLTAADQFVLEEIGIFDALAKGFIRSDKINPDQDVVIVYPGDVMYGLEAVYQNNLRFFSNKPYRAKETTSQTSWLNTAQKDQPVERVIFQHQPHPAVLEKAAKDKRLATIKKFSRMAAAIVMPFVAVGIFYVANKQKPEEPKNKIIEGKDEMTVTWKPSYSSDKVTMRFERRWEDGDYKKWTATKLCLNEAPLMKVIGFGDIGYIQTAVDILENETPDNTEHYVYTDDPLQKQPVLVSRP